MLHCQKIWGNEQHLSSALDNNSNSGSPMFDMRKVHTAKTLQRNLQRVKSWTKLKLTYDDNTGKVMSKVYQCWWRICQYINVSYKLEYHMFHILYLSVTYLLTLPPRKTSFREGGSILPGGAKWLVQS